MIEKIFSWLCPRMMNRLDAQATMLLQTLNFARQLRKDFYRKHLAVQAILRVSAKTYEQAGFITKSQELLQRNQESLGLILNGFDQRLKTLEVLEREILGSLPLSNSSLEFPTAVQRADRSWPRKKQVS